MESGSIKPGGISTAAKSVEGGSTGTNPGHCGGVAFELRLLGDLRLRHGGTTVGLTPGLSICLKIGPLSWDLLPIWYDDWLVIDRERQRQIRVHALEQMSAWFVSAERARRRLRLRLPAVTIDYQKTVNTDARYRFLSTRLMGVEF